MLFCKPPILKGINFGNYLIRSQYLFSPHILIIPMHNRAPSILILHPHTPGVIHLQLQRVHNLTGFPLPDLARKNRGVGQRSDSHPAVHFQLNQSSRYFWNYRFWDDGIPIHTKNLVIFYQLKYLWQIRSL